MLEISMTAPSDVGTKKTKHVTFHIDGQAPLKLPVHLEAVRPDS